MTGEPVTRPMTMEERVAAARQAMEAAADEDTTGEQVMMAMLCAFAPGLFNGTGWIAPMEATEEMTDAGEAEAERGYGNTKYWLDDVLLSCPLGG